MKSIIQDGKYCFLSGARNCQLHLHHIFNGPLRTWSDKNGLWVYLKWDEHEKLHKDIKTARRLKAIAQYLYERDHTHEEFMSHTHENYLMYLTEEDKKRYCAEYKPLDLSAISDDLLKQAFRLRG